jgi:hypothetical protein
VDDPPRSEVVGLKFPEVVDVVDDVPEVPDVPDVPLDVDCEPPVVDDSASPTADGLSRSKVDSSSMSELSDGSLDRSPGLGLSSCHIIELDGCGGVVELVCEEVDRDEVDGSIPPMVKDLMSAPIGPK